MNLGFRVGNYILTDDGEVTYIMDMGGERTDTGRAGAGNPAPYGRTQYNENRTGYGARTAYNDKGFAGRKPIQ